MNRLRPLYTNSLLHDLWREVRVRYRFKFVLPRITRTVLDGISLDLSRLSLKVRNRILMGLYEAHEKRMCEEFLTPADAVLEIGGAIGFIGLICQKNIGIRNYFVFEANPETLEILKANYQLNGLRPAAWNLALGPCEGALDLDVTSDFWDNSVCTPLAGGVRLTLRVPSAPLESLLGRTGHAVNVLIVDVEGAEQFIDWRRIPDQIDKVIIELHPTVLGAEKMYDLIGALIQRGFYVAREESGTFVFLKRPAAAGKSATLSWRVVDKEKDTRAHAADLAATGA
jgi:FkbM family methyltransferase